MRFIDFENKTPVNTPLDSDFPTWSPWSQEKWDQWLSVSEYHKSQMQKLHSDSKKKERNEYIDSNSAHWGELKEWLKVLSKGKCWFSEVRELYSHYDVEHFRPKKEAKNLDKTIRDGYWWLAFDYTNYRLCGNVGNRKKGGWFPLKEGSICSTYDTPREESEDIYLLDPTNPYDVNLLAFDEEGKAIPAPDCSEWEVQRVNETITRLKLNGHSDLAEARRKIWQQVNREVELFFQSKARCAKGGNPAAAEKLKEHCRRIRELTSPDAELSSVAKWCIAFKANPQLLKLVA